MASQPPLPQQRGLMSLYEDLLDDAANNDGKDQGTRAPPATAAAPGTGTPAAKPASETPKNPALRFQPILRRPQPTKAKTKKLPVAFPLASATDNAAGAAPAPSTAPSTTPLSLPTTATSSTTAAAPRSTLADWTKTDADDDDAYYGDDHGATGSNAANWLQRGGRKRKKKRSEVRLRREQEAALHVDWDELYDPTRPTNLEAYRHSDERVAAARAWKAVLYAHRRPLQDKLQNPAPQGDAEEDTGSDDDYEEARGPLPQFNSAFAPPPSPTAAATAPVAAGDGSHRSAIQPPPAHGHGNDDCDDYDDSDGHANHTVVPSTSTTPATHNVMPAAATNDNASVLPPVVPPKQRPPPSADTASASASPASPSAPAQHSHDPNCPNDDEQLPSRSSVSALAAGLIVAKPPVLFSAKSSDGTVADAHDDYESSHEPSLATSSTAPPATASRRPGQAGFATRLMAKYGWSRGTGLGADGSGIVTPLRHKREGGGASSGGPHGPRGRIVGGQRARATTATTTPAPQQGPASPETSTVVVLRHMLDGFAPETLAAEVADGQLVQEIGEECGTQYGRVQRVYVDLASHQVFLQFTDAVSALRSVQALRGRIFNGHAIEPSFYDEDKFEAGDYA